MKNTKKEHHLTGTLPDTIFFSFSKVSFPERIPPDGVQICRSFCYQSGCWFWAAGEWLSFHLIDRFLRQFRYFFY